MKTMVAGIAFAVGLAGCASMGAGRLKDITAARTGCAPEAVQIVKEGGGIGYHTWTAECSGKTFFCREATGEQPACTEAIKK